jgi:hypothetical protein
VAGPQGRQGIWINQHFDAARDAGASPDEAGALEREYHLMD